MDRFLQKKQFQRSMMYVADANAALVEQLWACPDELVDAGNKLVEKQCVRTTVRFSCEDEIFVVKRHRERSWRHFAKRFFSNSRAENCWSDTWYLIANGYPTPRPIAYCENRMGPFRGNSWYAYEYISGTTFKDAATGNRNQRQLRDYVNKLVEIWALHRNLQINLTDGHPANFIVDATGKMWVIDLDKLQYLNSRTDVDDVLRRSFESTIRGVIGDRFVVEYALSQLESRFTDIARVAA